MLVVVLVWIGKDTAVHTPKPARADQAVQADIAQVIKPMLDDEVTLTFEDELPDPTTITTQQASVHHMDKRHAVSLIIDDVGYDLHALERLLALPFTLTVSILPDASHAAEAARMAHQHGAVVMLHMPMQTRNPKYQNKMEKFYLHQDMSEEDFTRVFEAALAKVPYAVGVNNHMGSQLTENNKAMTWLMKLCLKHGLFFIDSRTTARSVAADVAQAQGVPWNTRDVFLDHSVAERDLQHAWNTTLNCIARNDVCVMLAHPHQETLHFLETQAIKLNSSSFIPVTEALRHEEHAD